MKEPDVTVTIRWIEPSMQFYLRTEGSMDVHCGAGRLGCQRDPWTKITEYLHSFQSDAKGLAGAEARGRELFLGLPDQIQNFLWDNRGRNYSLFVNSNGPWLPWEIMCLCNEESGDQDGFLCMRYHLSQWIGKDKDPAQYVNLSVGALVSDRNSIKTGLNQIGIRPKLIRPSDVVSELNKGEYGFWHFQNHNNLVNSNGDESCFLLGENQYLFPQDLNCLPTSFGQLRPLVFMGSCESALLGSGFSGVGGWPKRFIEAGAGAFIGIYVPIPENDVTLFSKHFYKALLDGEPIAQAFQEARNQLHGVNRYAFALFAWPDATEGSAPSQAIPKKSPPLKKSLRLRWSYFSTSNKVWIASGTVAALFGLFLVLGFATMHARERILRLNHLDYTLLTLLQTGLQMVVSSIPASVSALLHGPFPIKWSCRFLLIITGLLWFNRERLDSRPYKVGLLLGALLFFGTLALLDAGVGVTQSSSDLVLNGNIRNRVVAHAHAWLVNDGVANDRLRQQLFGLVVVVNIAISICLMLCLNFTKALKIFMMMVFSTLVFFGLRILPMGYAYAHWGLRYPMVEWRLSSGEKLDCCLFDVSAGAQKTALWGRCGDQAWGHIDLDQFEGSLMYPQLDYPFTITAAPCVSPNSVEEP